MSEPIAPLDWDSQFFNKRVGKVNVHTSESLASALALAREQGYELLYIHSSAAITHTTMASFSLLDVGGHITFAAGTSQDSQENDGSAPDIIEYRDQGLQPDLLHAALMSGHLSRFRIDPMLPAGSFERLYATWIENALANRPKATIYTYQAENKLAGFICSEMDESHCVIRLLSVLPSFRTRGIGSKLIQRVKEACMTNGIKEIKVTTQLSNHSARSLYIKNSFVELERAFLYHGHRL